MEKLVTHAALGMKDVHSPSCLSLVLLTNIYALDFDSNSRTLSVFYIEISQLDPYIKAKLHQLTIEGRDLSELGVLYNLINNTMEDNLGGKRKVCVILNPAGGNKTAQKTYEKVVKPMLDTAQIPHELILTEHQHHAYMLASQIDMDIFGSLMVVGGDGILHEVINGLLSRVDWQSTKDLPIGIMPCGTSNAVARSIGISDPVYACYSILRGKRTTFDAMLFEQNGNRFYGHFAFFWGLIADSDLGGDSCRCCGRCRMIFSALYQIFRFKTYHAVIEYLDAETPSIPPSENQGEGISARYKHMFTPDNPMIKRLPEATYHSFLATKHAWLDLQVPASHCMTTETDLIDVMTIPKHASITRGTLLRAMANDDIASLHDDQERCWHGKVRACQLLFREYEGIKLDIDGELVSPGNIYLESVPSILSIYTPYR